MWLQSIIINKTHRRAIGAEENKMNNNLLLLSAIAIAILMVSCGSNKTKDNNSSSDNFDLEQSQDLIYNSHDLAFFDLHGKVKSCQTTSTEYDWLEPQTISFDDNGMLIPNTSWYFEEYAETYPELKHISQYERNDEGYIVKQYFVSDAEGITSEEFQWDGEKVISIKSDSETGSTTFEYAKGLLQTKQVESHGGEGWEFSLDTYTYTDYEFDKQNNWIKRSCSKTTHEIDDLGEKHFVSDKNFIEKRTIIY